MANRSPRKFDLDFKKQAVSLVLNEGLSKNEVAKRLDISPSLMGHWVESFKENGENAFPGKGRLSPEQDEIRRLKQELRRVSLERDILKKTIGLFAEPLK